MLIPTYLNIPDSSIIIALNIRVNTSINFPSSEQWFTYDSKYAFYFLY